MLTTPINNNQSFVVRDLTYNVGDRIELDETEKKMLQECCKHAHEMSSGKLDLLQRVWDSANSFDKDLASDFYGWEDVKFKHTTTATLLLRSVTRRLGGILPLQLITSDTDPHVAVRPLSGPDDHIMLTTDVVGKGIQFDLIAGDLHTSATTLSSSSEDFTCNISDWPDFGAPFVDIPTAALKTPFDLSYAEDLLTFSWEDHENHGVDLMTVTALGAIVGNPQRLNGLRSGQLPFPLLAFVFGPETTRVVNLTQVTTGNEQDRFSALQNAAEAMSADAFSLLQFGQLINAGSKVDSEQYQQNQGQPWGFSATIAVRTGAGAVIGAKSWVISQEPNKEPSLQTYGVFEDNSGLPGPNVTEALLRILAHSSGPGASEAAEDEPQEEVVSASS